MAKKVCFFLSFFLRDDGEGRGREEERKRETKG